MSKEGRLNTVTKWIWIWIGESVSESETRWPMYNVCRLVGGWWLVADGDSEQSIHWLGVTERSVRLIKTINRWVFLDSDGDTLRRILFGWHKLIAWLTWGIYQIVGGVSLMKESALQYFQNLLSYCKIVNKMWGQLWHLL